MYIRSFLGLLLACVSIQAAAVALAAPATCYFPSGDAAPGNVPCNNGTEFSSCCSSASSCLANGLCLVNTDEDTVEFGRGGCTDKSWNSASCFGYCRINYLGQVMTNGAAVFECDTVGYDKPASYCCETGDDQKTSCCQNPSLRFALGAGLPTGTQTIGSSSIMNLNSMSMLTLTTTSTSSTATISTTTSSSTQQTTLAVAAISSGDSGNERLHGTASISGQGSTDTSTSQAVAGFQTSPTSSLGSGSTSANSNETMIIIIGVTIPVLALFTALIVFLIWNNRRNSREIRLLKDGLRYGPSNSSVSRLSSPTEYKSTVTVGKSLPSYPHPTWRSDYWRHSQALGSRPRIGGGSGAYELPDSLDPQELDSANMSDTASEHNQI